MTNEENKKELTELEGQEIDGSTVLGGGSEIGLTEDFSGEVGMTFEPPAGLENMEPVDQMSIITENPTGNNLNPPTSTGPDLGHGPGFLPIDPK